MLYTRAPGPPIPQLTACALSPASPRFPHPQALAVTPLLSVPELFKIMSILIDI